MFNVSKEKKRKRIRMILNITKFYTTLTTACYVTSGKYVNLSLWFYSSQLGVRLVAAKIM